MLCVTLSVGGMTCAACSSTVGDILQSCQGVSRVAVNLLGLSATMYVERKGLLEGIVKAVVDAGFTAEVFKVVPVRGHNEPGSENIRTITLRVDDLRCP
jgi:Cu+-exporting ATPase